MDAPPFENIVDSHEVGLVRHCALFSLKQRAPTHVQCGEDGEGDDQQKYSSPFVGLPHHYFLSIWKDNLVATAKR